ncbi:hypothetical protein B0J13DRAFT_457857 [Dactylonectria estremocensis]|uniref:C2H2-type domain-containing protein n=1 Tax=Dactylonectria estremocensis TaxID=1079267 RepID=A0A9P9DI62_9HYPO|nr:hypothetical protein B0J13DRAFT_457857 [Dactylonectria estremocensis]
MGPFVFLPQVNLVVCTQCMYCVIVAHIDRHLRQPCHRRFYTQKQRCDIISEVLTIPDVIKDKAELQQWPWPPPSIDPIPYIKPPMQDGLGCNACPYVARQVKRIQKHYQERHEWVNERKRGRYTTKSLAAMSPVPWRSNVTCQRVFDWGHKSSWFEVSRGRAISEARA